MSSYVAFLRGLNLGRNRRVAMADLREWLTDLGYAHVRTHLQSGNALFQSSKAPDLVTREIEARLAEETGFAVDCVMRTADELRTIVRADPLGEFATDPSRYLVSFLATTVSRDRLPDLDPAAVAPERFHVEDREIYFWCPDGVRDSKVLRAFAESRLQVVATVRNWNTVVRLQTLSAG